MTRLVTGSTVEIDTLAPCVYNKVDARSFYVRSNRTDDSRQARA